MVDSTGSADGSLGRKDKHRKAFSLSALPAFLSLSLKSSSQENNSASSGGSNILASSNSSNGLAVTSLFSGQSPPPSQQHLPGRASGSRSGATSPQMQVASSNSRLSSGFSDAEIDRSPIPMVNVLRSGQSSSNNSAGAEGAPDLKVLSPKHTSRAVYSTESMTGKQGDKAAWPPRVFPPFGKKRPAAFFSQFVNHAKHLYPSAGNQSTAKRARYLATRYLQRQHKQQPRPHI